MTIAQALQAGVQTASAEETQSLAEALAQVLPIDATVALYGDLGVGKTTFVQGLARGLGITTQVTSPTYTIYTLYRGNRLLAHLDAYRLDSPVQVDSLLLDDFLVSPYCIAVEWPEKIEAWLPEDAWRLDLGLSAQGVHSIRLRVKP